MNGGEDSDVENDDDQQTDDVHGHVRSLVVPDERVVQDQVVGLAQPDVDIHQHRVTRY